MGDEEARPAGGNAGKRGAPSTFLSHLVDMLQVESPDIIAWTEDGCGFTIFDMERFTNEVCPRHFKHGKFSSFQRQLNLYGFHKMGRTPDAGTYTHPQFRRDNLAEARNIQRLMQPRRKDKVPGLSARQKERRSEVRRAVEQRKKAAELQSLVHEIQELAAQRLTGISGSGSAGAGGGGGSEDGGGGGSGGSIGGGSFGHREAADAAAMAGSGGGGALPCGGGGGGEPFGGAQAVSPTGRGGSGGGMMAGSPTGGNRYYSGGFDLPGAVSRSSMGDPGYVKVGTSRQYMGSGSAGMVDVTQSSSGGCSNMGSGMGSGGGVGAPGGPGGAEGLRMHPRVPSFHQQQVDSAVAAAAAAGAGAGYTSPGGGRLAAASADGPEHHGGGGLGGPRGGSGGSGAPGVELVDLLNMTPALQEDSMTRLARFIYAEMAPQSIARTAGPSGGGPGGGGDGCPSGPDGLPLGGPRVLGMSGDAQAALSAGDEAQLEAILGPAPTAGLSLRGRGAPDAEDDPDAWSLSRFLESFLRFPPPGGTGGARPMSNMGSEAMPGADGGGGGFAMSLDAPGELQRRQSNGGGMGIGGMGDAGGVGKMGGVGGYGGGGQPGYGTLGQPPQQRTFTRTMSSIAGALNPKKLLKRSGPGGGGGGSGGSIGSNGGGSDGGATTPTREPRRDSTAAAAASGWPRPSAMDGRGGGDGGGGGGGVMSEYSMSLPGWDDERKRKRSVTDSVSIERSLLDRHAPQRNHMYVYCNGVPPLPPPPPMPLQEPLPIDDGNGGSTAGGPMGATTAGYRAHGAPAAAPVVVRSVNYAPDRNSVLVFMENGEQQRQQAATHGGGAYGAATAQQHPGAMDPPGGAQYWQYGQQHPPPQQQPLPHLQLQPPQPPPQQRPLPQQPQPQPRMQPPLQFQLHNISEVFSMSLNPQPEPLEAEAAGENWQPSDEEDEEEDDDDHSHGGGGGHDFGQR